MIFKKKHSLIFLNLERVFPVKHWYWFNRFQNTNKHLENLEVSEHAGLEQVPMSLGFPRPLLVLKRFRRDRTAPSCTGVRMTLSMSLWERVAPVLGSTMPPPAGMPTLPFGDPLSLWMDAAFPGSNVRCRNSCSLAVNQRQKTYIGTMTDDVLNFIVYSMYKSSMHQRL